MKYIDRIYGISEIREPVLLDIIDTFAMQRLKGVDVGGYIEPYFPGAIQSRFEHSMGVFLLLKKYGAAIEELIAGLIHDVSHSAFSHCIDYVLAEGSESEHNLQDNIFENFLKETEIPSLLKKHGFDFEYIINDENFLLKEQNLPELCADRIDYALRGAVIFNAISAFEAQQFLNHLIVVDRQWVFADIDYAKRFAELFLKLNTDYFSGLLSAIMFRTTGDYLKHGLRQNYISLQDVYTTDSQVLAKLSHYHQTDTWLLKLFNRLNRKTACINDPCNYDVKVSCKSRIVDPLCLVQNKIIKLSESDDSWREIIQAEAEPKEYFLKFGD